MMVKEIILFCYGDSTNISTWSNIPYLLGKTLEKKTITVHRVNLAPPYVFEFLWNKIILNILRFFFKGIQYEASRSLIVRFLANAKIKQSVKKYNADLCIFTSFSFYNKYNDIPSLLLCDWSYETLIKERLKRKPYILESIFINKEQSALKNADLIISLFPEAKDSIKKQIPQSNVQWANFNVVNTVYEGSIDSDELILNKYNSNKILFIGKKHYIKGAELLIKSFLVLKQKYPKLELHIVGLEKNDIKGLFGNELNDIFFYGFLHKERDNEKNIYYDLILSAKIFINPTPIWGGYSSTIESMYYYTPVILSPYKDFVKEFGEDIDFGIYNNTFSENDLVENISKILELDESNYRSISKRAHDVVKDYTWDNYVDWMIKEFAFVKHVGNKL